MEEEHQGIGISPNASKPVSIETPVANLALEQAEAELSRRFGPAVKRSKYIVAFALSDGREIALEPGRAKVQIWIEADHGVPERFEPKRYAPTQGRNSNLSSRLHFSPPAGQQPRAVALVRTPTADTFTDLLDWYQSPPGELDRRALEVYRQAFLALYPDFKQLTFAAQTGGYFEEERAYKNELIRLTRQALVDFVDKDDAALGERALDIVTGQAGAVSNLLGWRTNAFLRTFRASQPGKLESAVGRLIRAPMPTAAVAAFVEETWQDLAEGQKSKPYSASRNIPSMLAALAHPESAYGINTEPLGRFAQAVLGRPLFGSNPMTLDEYADVIRFANQIFQIMRDEWGWEPRDLWDIQGFIWVVNQTNLPNQPKIDAEAPIMNSTKPTNLILYGPPGTGKTYATRREAVLLCNGDAPDQFEDLSREYKRLVEAGRIEFVTFHQSYSYEDFVEALRPMQGEGGSGGFQLAPTMGVFRRIARRAETSTSSGDDTFVLGDRRVFKMSIGEAANPDDAHRFESAIAGGYTVLGFDDIDWSDPKYESREEIIAACKAYGTEAGQAPPTAHAGRVQSPFIFRNWIRERDLIVVSKGNLLFRAIGEVIGAYQYAPDESGEYSHRRAVRWLWIDRAGVPVEEIFTRVFSQRTIYLLERSELNIPALERYIASQQKPSGSERESFVLIVDEINRANISKVFGELITLLEADKRIGAPNEIRVRLPYSHDMFGVPPNLHIIGTMNTADRSIALLDTALRRRFVFRELMPDPDLLEGRVEGVDLPSFLGRLNERIEYLFDREHQIGHALFMGCRTISDVDDVMRHSVIPLLQEYFYEDWNKVAAILGDSNGDGRFLARHALAAPSDLEGDDGGTPRYRWTVKAEFGPNRYA